MTIDAHRRHTTRDIAAYLLDRADQYDTDSPCWIALCDAARNVMQGEIGRAKRENEFDAKLYKRVDSFGPGAARPVDPRLGVDDCEDE